MSELQDLYQEVILDHNRQPRNFRKLEGADHQAEGYNPLCGDQLTVYLHMEGDRVADISFVGSGCAISKASASVMTTSVKGKTRREIQKLFDQFHRMVMGQGDIQKIASEVGKLAVFSGVSEFPARVKCASLAWHTLKAALEGVKEAVSTESDEAPAKVDVEELRQKIVEKLKTCFDPEIPVNIYELGLIYDVSVKPAGEVEIQMTLTTPACPVAGSLPPEVEAKVKAIPGVASVKVEVVWEPPWSPAMMSEAARLQLGML